MGKRRMLLVGVVAVVTAATAVFPADATSVTAAERRCGNPTGRIELTFDDGADPARVSALLDVLSAKGVRAGFFLVGRWADTHPGLVARMRNDGHWLGNHSATHADLARASAGALRNEIAGGVPGELLRPPYGSVNGAVRAAASSAGYRLCLWDIDTNDWRGRSVPEIDRTVWSGLRPGAVVLLHLHGRNTLAALPGLIDGIRERGFELDPLAPFAAAAVDGSSAPLLLRRDGTVLGGPGGAQVVGAAPVPAGDAVAVASRPAGRPGFWVATAGGGLHAVAGAPFLGSEGRLNAPLVAVVSTPSGEGYWTVGADGGVFAHGDAGFFGSTGDLALNAPVVAMAASPTGGGYWLLGRDGGVFAFGDAAFQGSAAGAGGAPFVGIAARAPGDAYALLRRDGGVVRIGGAGAGELPSVTAAGSGDGGVRTGLAIAPATDDGGYVIVTDRPGETYRIP